MTRPATIDDLPRLIEISLASFGSITWQREVDRQFGPLKGLDWSERWRRRVEKAFREQTILVLVDGADLVGYACGTLDAAVGLAHLDILAVDPAAQGRGYGRRLLHAFEDHFRAQGATHLTLESLVDNETANALYTAEGYRRLARHINWFKKLGCLTVLGISLVQTRNPLPVVAAQKRAIVFAGSYRAATEGSGYEAVTALPAGATLLQ